MRRFYAPPESFTDGRVRLSEDETRHLRDVLRLPVGDEINVFDGEGREFTCRIEQIEKRVSDVSIIGEVSPTAPESTLDLTVAAAVLPGEKFDLVVQKMVELGANRLIPLSTIRSEVKIKDAGKRLTRWRRIVMEATKQCGRAALMTVEEPVSLSDIFLELSGSEMLFFSERDGNGLDITTPAKRLAIVFGPKGGWDDAELELARASGASIVTLGGRVLRAETAAIGITAILQHRLGDMS